MAEIVPSLLPNVAEPELETDAPTSPPYQLRRPHTASVFELLTSEGIIRSIDSIIGAMGGATELKPTATNTRRRLRLVG